ncbi:NHLP leader peptide family RiPP precursor [Pannonibacter tanglangensis]|uniref:NHLP leader peptide family natural product n=1 Tax=Pannonibacter tanglangensis TaxID=2750084 RepID=A0ABW9ZPV5_9HYPH|nr:NHLP leader peptide family RiPP precursor [Pannonibacter sp. XCT-34]NBN65087.1 NHLP leader peptide family natural product precursor [Pannonibacter sp. XCT-34]
MSDSTPSLTEARAQLEASVLRRAAEDAEFRALLLADPHAALGQLLGTDPVPSLKIRVVEEVAGEVVLVLPRQIAQDELPDELLDFAAGGNARECWDRLNYWLYKNKPFG